MHHLMMNLPVSRSLGVAALLRLPIDLGAARSQKASVLAPLAV